MAPDTLETGVRAHVRRLDPDFLVQAPPASKLILIGLDLGAQRATLEYNLPRAEALHRDLGNSIELAKRTPYARARTVEQEQLGYDTGRRWDR